jgi:hypothetical protein
MASGEVVNEISCCGADDVARAVAAARAVQPGWAVMGCLHPAELRIGDPSHLGDKPKGDRHVLGDW